MARFEGQTVLVTGGTSGIGRATAERLATEGATVFVTGTNAERLAEVGAIDGITAIANDAGDPAAAKALAEQLPDLDHLFLNAGFGVFAPHNALTAENFAAQMDVNVRGPILQVAALSDKLKDGGSVLITTSIVQHMSMDASSLYTASKGAMRSYVRVLARELAPRNIRVNGIAPGPIGTDFFARTGMPEEQTSAMAERVAPQVPLGRFGTPEEIANVATFMMSKEASYVTGADFTVDGGMAMH
ncbi:MAG: SDR family oxidoreductase [Parvularculaceae bacterium]|nr:SDR family oxidoreductase [Parvularculaceae bacterium]